MGLTHVSRKFLQRIRESTSRLPPPSANKAAHSGFETHQKSKIGVSVAP